MPENTGQSSATPLAWTDEHTYKLTSDLLQAMTSQEVAQGLLNAFAVMLKTSGGLVMLRQVEGDHLVRLAQVGRTEPMLPDAAEIIAFDADHGFALAARTQQPIWHDDRTQALYLPLICHQQIYGVVGLAFEALPALDEGQQRVIGVMVDQAAIALERALRTEIAIHAASIKTRQDLARDLHDTVTQTLFSTNMITEAMVKAAEQKQEDSRMLKQLYRLNRGALAEMRNLLLELRPEHWGDYSIAELLPQITHAVMGRTRLEFTLEVQDALPSIPVDARIALCRITQEALNNAIKYASASHVSIELRHRREGLVLLIDDDGVGFDPVTAHTGMGLANIRERASAIGGNCTITSSNGNGTQIKVVLANVVAGS